MSESHRQPDTLGERLASRRRSRFVGRAAEIELFLAALESPEPPYSALFVHGPGGIGKSSLLEVLEALAAERGSLIARLDGKELAPSPRAVRAAFEKARDSFESRAPADDAPAAGRLVIILDTYERLASLDDWVRTELAPSLPAAAILVIAGRAPPAPGWRRDPAWRELLRVISLRNLSPDESRRYLEACAVPPDRYDRLIATSHGHPLGLSLLADVVTRGGEPSVDVLAPDLVEILVRQFVDVVPSESQRRALGVAALARVTTQALLRDTVGSDDAHELFSWLRELSFMEVGPEGIVPHDLARDVLDVDMRWRDPDGYRSTFRAVRAHVHARLAQTRGRAQQRAIFDEKFLFRNLPSVLSPVDWQTWGAHYPEPALPGDRAQILELTERWEGAASAAIAARWLDAQPEGFSVIRQRDHAVSGFLAIVDLTAASAEELEADPGAKAAWDYAQRRAPARPGDVVTQARFLIDREAYQAPSPTLNAAPIATIQRQLSTPRLAWDFLTLAEPEPWDAYFEIADLHRAMGADFVVDGRRFGLFAHDFRKVPVDRWLELVTERALEQDFTLPPPRDSEALVLSQAEFEDAVRQALRHLRDPAPLARSPLLRSGVVRGAASGAASGGGAKPARGAATPGAFGLADR